MIRLVVTAAAGLAALALTPAAGVAQGSATSASYYTAVPVTMPAKSSFITRSTVWNCGNGACTAGRGGSRDAIMCELLVREVGALQSFSVQGEAMSADALAKCNARAR